MTQKIYVQKKLIDFGMENYTPTIISMDERKKLKVDIRKEEMDLAHYCSIVGKCLHLIYTSPDI